MENSPMSNTRKMGKWSGHIHTWSINTMKTHESSIGTNESYNQGDRHWLVIEKCIQFDTIFVQFQTSEVQEYFTWGCIAAVVQFPSRVWLLATTWTAACQGSLSFTISSNSCPFCWWCHPNISSSVLPFYSCLQSFPASGSFPVSQFFISGGQNIKSFSFSISTSNEYSGLISYRMDWFDLLAVQGTLTCLLQHNTILKAGKFGTSWCSSGWDSTLPTQWVWVQSMVRQLDATCYN